jgi:hypothetical protein
MSSPAALLPLLLLWLPPHAGCAGAAPPKQQQRTIDIGVDWAAAPARVASTASTVEVDVMPFLGRTSEGGPFNGYFEALSNLGCDFVRYAPCALATRRATPAPLTPLTTDDAVALHAAAGYPYPQVVVTELTPPDCTSTRPATNWNSSLFDGIMRDFMTAVCGPGAVMGKCKHSVAQQLSTMPE